MDEIARNADTVKQDLHLGWIALSRWIGIQPRRLRRWSERASLHQPQMKRPGPRKQDPVPQTLEQEIRDLRHGCKRSRGVGELQRRHETVISRRDLDALVHRARREHHRRLRESRCRVEWTTPQVAWAFDGAESAKDHQKVRLVLHPIHDLASRHRFEPLVSLTASGPEIAIWLRGQFDLHGAPLFLKRDNGSPLNHTLVNELLAEYGVIPLNSPPHYPRYNGAIENAVRELKDHLGLSEAPPSGWEVRSCRLQAQTVIKNLNQTPRRCLAYQTARDVYASGRRAWTLEERRAIFNWIIKRQCVIIQSMKDAKPRTQAKAWRQSVEEWLLSHDFIRIHKPTKQNQIVSPYFHDRMGHN